MRDELTQLGRDIDALRLRIDREDGHSKHLQSELDELKQEQRLKMEAMDQFESDTAGEWDAFRKGMDQAHQELRERLDAIAHRLPGTDSSEDPTR